ncbi:MAG: DsbA family protein [Pseudomonadota bacterium]|nr:DsbA family protein [Pseudomonadota bacterium]
MRSYVLTVIVMLFSYQSTAVGNSAVGKNNSAVGKNDSGAASKQAEAAKTQAVKQQVVFTIHDHPTMMDEIAQKNKQQFYEIENKRYGLIENEARAKYLDYFWEQRALKSKKSLAQEKRDYFAQHVKVDKKREDEMLEQLKEHPQFAKLTAAERRTEVKKYLQSEQQQLLLNGIVDAALASGKLVINYPKPIEPRFDIKVTSADPVRYGAKDTETKPISCRGDDCVTIVEYSEYQCPFCARIIPTATEVLTKYRGKVRWIVRDFPLSFHDRAKPAAIAARCAMKQGKFWQMYAVLFNNQSALSDKDFEGYADRVGVDKPKWQECLKDTAVAAAVDNNFQSGVRLGVTGTPAFFINGRRLSGAVPFSAFKKIIDEELRAKG